jgi:hypothetical protein
MDRFTPARRRYATTIIRAAKTKTPQPVVLESLMKSIKRSEVGD